MGRTEERGVEEEGRWMLWKEEGEARKEAKPSSRGREVPKRPAKTWIRKEPFMGISCWIRTWLASTARVILPGRRRWPAMRRVPGGLKTLGLG